MQVRGTKVTAADVAALRAARRDCLVEWDGPEPADIAAKRFAREHDPEFEQWVNSMAALPTNQQTLALFERLRQCNPGWSTPPTRAKIQGSIVTEFVLSADNIADLSPLRGLPDLRHLECAGNAPGSSILTDLAPLAGMSLISLRIDNTNVAKLSALKDCKSLRELEARETQLDQAEVAALQAALPDCTITWSRHEDVPLPEPPAK